MKTVTDIDKMKTHSRIMKKENKLIGLVPTMGYLHEGHLSLIRNCRKQSEIVVLSIFVNPAQFGPNEDFKKYPRDIKSDEELARSAGVDVIFYPRAEDMYPASHSTYVNTEGLTDSLCGKSRPGHFRGVTTVVTKLFEIVKPDITYFGQKDAQQAFIVKKMIEDLNMDISMKILPTVREEDGLAMSSRNAYLSKTERPQAAFLYKSLKLAEDLIASGDRKANAVIKKMEAVFLGAPSAKIDYISIVDTKKLKNAHIIKGEILIALAVFIGKIRLIDNIIVKV